MGIWIQAPIAMLFIVLLRFVFRAPLALFSTLERFAETIKTVEEQCNFYYSKRFQRRVWGEIRCEIAELKVLSMQHVITIQNKLSLEGSYYWLILGNQTFGGQIHFGGGCWVSVSWSYHLRQTLDKEWSKVWMAHVGCQCTSSPITTLRSQCGSLSCTYMCIWDQNEQQQCKNNSGMTQFFQFSFQTSPFLLLLW